MLEQTKAYLDQHSELIILEWTHFCNTTPEDAAFLSLLNSTLGDRIYTEQNTETKAFVNRTLKELLSSGGKVLMLFEGIQTEDRTKGYFAESFIDQNGSYANEPYLAEMKADQLQKFENYTPTDSSIFSISWTQTMNTALAVTCLGEEENPLTIEDISQEATADLEKTLAAWIQNGSITKNKIPNIISVDFASTLVTEQCIKVSEFNLN